MIKISNIKIREYKNKFIKKTNLGKKKYNYRKGFFLEIHGVGTFGIGEAAPIPEISLESLNDVEYALQGFKLALEGLDYDVSIKELLLLSRVHGDGLPSAMFCLESAIYDLFSKLNNQPIASILKANYLNEINVNCIDSQNSLIDKSISKVIKIKIDNSDPVKIENKIRAVLKKCNDETKVRLDFNGRLTLRQAKNIFQILDQFDIDYVEQPFDCKNLDAIGKLKKITNISIAADESATNLESIKNLIEKELADVIIVKPTLVGSFLDIEKINNLCKKNFIRVVVTSSFETQIAQNYIIHLIAALGIKEYCGVANVDLFSKSNSIRMKNEISIDKLLGKK